MLNENRTLLTFLFKSHDIQILEVILGGRIMDRETATEMVTSIVERLDEEHNKVVLDLSSVDYINSNGLNNLISILTKTRTRGGDVVLCNINEKIEKLLLITKLNTVFTTAESVEEAVALLNS